MKIDILAFAAHPDDVEISCGGTILKHIAEGRTVGLIDLTQGELGTRGSGGLRLVEAENARKVLGVAVRENLGMADGFFTLDMEHKLRIAEMVRKYRPEIVLANSIHDRHPDHGRASQLVSEGCFLAGLPKVVTTHHGESQQAWRPRAVYHYIQDRYIRPDIVIDVTPFFDQKIAAIKAYGSQFFDPQSDAPSTPISGEDFFDFLRGRAKEFGRPIGAKYAEGFTAERHVG
ncbi:MAG: bacillithiol biosynthesis deacetylase BshB1, partial [Flavobacteriales bacterium]|nr:bacillithiol biosynthesis deacetylase BshB1 [Flavobacteriales bacterium]